MSSRFDNLVQHAGEGHNITLTRVDDKGNESSTGDSLIMRCSCGDDLEEIPDEIETVTCSICGEDVPAGTAHLHQGKWIGDDCCWDERLKASE